MQNCEIKVPGVATGSSGGGKGGGQMGACAAGGTVQPWRHFKGRKYGILKSGRC